MHLTPVPPPPLDLLGVPVESTVQLLTVAQVAGLLGLGSDGTVAVRILDAAGRGPLSYRVGGGILWCRSDVLDWLRDNSPRDVLLEVASQLRDLATAFEY